MLHSPTLPGVSREHSTFGRFGTKIGSKTQTVSPKTQTVSPKTQTVSPKTQTVSSLPFLQIHASTLSCKKTSQNASTFPANSWIKTPLIFPSGYFDQSKSPAGHLIHFRCPN